MTGAYRSNKTTYDALVLWRCDPLALGILTQHLLCHGIVPSVISVLQALLFQTVLDREFMPARNVTQRGDRISVDKLGHPPSSDPALTGKDTRSHVYNPP